MVAQLTFNQLVVGSSPTGPIMIDPQDAMERIARLDDEMDIQPKLPIPDQKIFALQMYDRVVIVTDLIMEHWLEGNANPPQELIDEYFDAVDWASQCINNNRLHEEVVRGNADFYEEIHAKFGLSENKKKNLDTTPDLF